MIKLNPYLNFPGTAEEAFNFYRSVFGGEFQSLMRFGDMPNMEQSSDQKDKIMHIALPIGDEVLMATDTAQTEGDKLQHGNDFSLSINPDSKEDTDRIFRALSEGGEIESAMKDEMWGDYFGMLKDRFGVRWMINFTKKNGN